jgi:hypothetical protein
MERLVAAGGLREWAPRAFSEFAQTRPLHAIGTRGYPWIEIDFPEDYQRAVREVIPAIAADETAACGRSRTTTIPSETSPSTTLPIASNFQ